VTPPALRVGARTSRLARYQASLVIESLPAGCTAEFVGLRTSGDLAPDVPIHAIGGTGVFTREIERALLSGEIDVAVHSLKDLATVMPDGLELAACLPREDPRDALVVARTAAPPGTPAASGLGALPRGAVVGTASLRRRAFLLRARRDLRVESIRGNVPTRIDKLHAGAYDAIVLAAAGLVRLGLQESISSLFAADVFPPAPGQGAIAVQIRSGDERTALAVASLDDWETRTAVTAERAFLRRIEGGCQAPAGALARVSGPELRLETLVCSLDGTRAVASAVSGSADDAADLGREAAERSLGDGAAAILDELRRAAERA
jgi:hydroxymethylbilane synthase